MSAFLVITHAKVENFAVEETQIQLLIMPEKQQRMSAQLLAGAPQTATVHASAPAQRRLDLLEMSTKPQMFAGMQTALHCLAPMPRHVPRHTTSTRLSSIQLFLEILFKVEDRIKLAAGMLMPHSTMHKITMQLLTTKSHFFRLLAVTASLTSRSSASAVHSTPISQALKPGGIRAVAAISRAVETIKLAGIQTPQTTIQPIIHITRQLVAMKAVGTSLHSTSALLARILLALAFPTHAPPYPTLETTVRGLAAQGTA